MGRLGQTLEEQIIRITVAPLLTGFERLDDRMFSRVIMFRRMTVRRTVAAADVTADLAQAQMEPTSTDLQTIFTAISARRDRNHLG